VGILAGSLLLLIIGGDSLPCWDGPNVCWSCGWGLGCNHQFSKSAAERFVAPKRDYKKLVRDGTRIPDADMETEECLLHFEDAVQQAHVVKIGQRLPLLS
jgi:hypothetical protein